MKTFERLYDVAKPVKDVSRCRLERVMTPDGKDTGCLQVITDKNPFDAIKNLLEVKDKKDRTDVMPLEDIYHLYDAFVYKSVLEPEVNVSQYIHALSWFKGNIDKGIKFLLDLTHSAEWVQALGYLKGSLPKSNSDEIVGENKQQKDRAQAVAYLRKKFSVEYSFDSHYRLRLSKEDEVASFVAKLMADFGGARYLACFLPHFDYVPAIDRLYIPRHGYKGLPQYQSPEVPLNYLLNLAIAYLCPDSENNGTADETLSEYNHIHFWAMTYCLAYYEAQSYSIWNLIFHRDCSVIGNWMRLAYKDGLNYFRQTSQDFIMDYCGFIVDSAKKKAFLRSMPYTLDNLWELCRVLMQLTEPHKTVMFDKDMLMNVANAEAVLEDISQPLANVNTNFELAADYDKVTYWTHPVIKVDEGRYLLLPKTIGASCWYDRLTSILRTNASKGFEFQTWLGNVQEEYVISKCNQKGISVKTGKYKVQWNTSEKAEEGEADFIVEGTGFKLLIESKTKSFTRKALSGFDVNILLDLVQGLFNSQTQAYRTAATLCCKGKVDLCDEQWNHVDDVDYTGEKLEEITLTYGDYGFFQDRILVDRILNDIYKCDYSLDVDSIPDEVIPASSKKCVKKSFAKIAEEQDKMRRYINELAKVDEKKVKHLFFDSWHLNLEQLVYLLSLSNDADGFYKELMRCKHLNTTTLDFWNERHHMEQISNAN